MENETLDTALNEISSILRRCEKIQPQFAEGSAQHSLLKNRIAALQAADLLLKRERWGEHTDQRKIQPSAASDAVNRHSDNADQRCSGCLFESRMSAYQERRKRGWKDQL